MTLRSIRNSLGENRRVFRYTKSLVMSGPVGGRVGKREGGAESTPAISVMLQENTHTVDSLADKSDEPKQRDDQSLPGRRSVIQLRC